MSPRSVSAIRQAMARMLYDPAFVTQVRAGPVPGLTEPERALLLQVDPRAWGTDRFRRSRGVHALLDEYPVTGAILGVAEVSAFFSSSAFAGVLSGRGSLALAFGEAASRGPAGAVARLELAIATARRQATTPVPPGPRLRTRPGVVPVRSTQPVLEAFSAGRARLGSDPTTALIQGHVRLPAPSPAGPAVFVLVECSAQGEVGVGGGSEALHSLLTAVSVPTTRPDALAIARRLGCDAGEDAALIDELVADQLLVGCP